MTPSFSRTLKYTVPMMQGRDVRILQRALFRLGLLARKGIDGLFGPGTRRSVKAFQRQRGLKVDGVAGSDTFDALAGIAGTPKGSAAKAPAAKPPAAAPATGGKVPASWMPAAGMKRIILHWTGGTHQPSNGDKKHYHILIDSDGGLHRGKHAITANVPPLRESGYAAHTKKCNSWSIGVSLCAMGGKVQESPFQPGPFPVTRAQWEALAQVAAELCLRYGIPITRTTVLGHGEVQANLGIQQDGKWDPMALPWDPDRPYAEIGDHLRTRAQEILDGLTNPQAETEAAPDPGGEAPPVETVTLDGTPLRGASIDGRTWLDLAHLVENRGWAAPLIDTEAMTATFSDPPLVFGIDQSPDSAGFTKTWVQVAEVSERLGLALEMDDAGNLHLKSLSTGGPQRRVVVKRGQTLSQIALLFLGDRNRWRDLRTEDGRAFDEDSARRLQVGQVVILPGDANPAPDISPGTPQTQGQIGEIARKIAKLEGGGTNMEQIRSDAVSNILSACAANNVNDLSHQAYILATAYHETNLGQFMTELWGPTDLQKTYGSRLGNRSDAEGKLYRGRGFVQITGRDNYTKYSQIFGQDFVGDPELVARRDIAAQILVRGMAEFGFTGKGLLSDMGFDGDFDWFNARSLINGDKNRTGDKRYPGLKKGEGIARKARKYREIIATS